MVRKEGPPVRLEGFAFFNPPDLPKSENPDTPLSSRKAQSPAPPLKPALPEKAMTVSRADPDFVPRTGRVRRDFAPTPAQRVWQAEQILKNYGKWPPSEGELFVIQIDQDSPSPAPRRPAPAGRWLAGKISPEEFAWRNGFAAIWSYLTHYTGKTCVFRAVVVNRGIQLQELNPSGPFVSASHAGQIDPAGQASCNGRVCGIPWLRSGIYTYKAHRLANVFNPLEDARISVARDQNQDGVIDLRESIASAQAHGFAVQIHAGLYGAPKSVGCQTMPPGDFEAFRKLINQANVETFSYILVRRPNDATGEYIW